MYTAQEAQEYTETCIKEDILVYADCIPKNIDELIRRAAHRGQYEFLVEMRDLIDRDLPFNWVAFQAVFQGIEKDLKGRGFAVKIDYPNVGVSW